MTKPLKKIIITGGAGFIGSNLTTFFLRNYKSSQVIVIDKLSYAGKKRNLSQHFKNKNFLFVRESIGNSNKIKKYFKNVDLLINTAAESHVDNSFLNPKKFLKTNLIDTFNLFQLCLKTNVKKLIHFSTDEVYGPRFDSNPAKETDVLAPTNPYSASKASADMIISSLIKSFNFKCIVVRPCNIYGSNQFKEKLIPRFLSQLSNKKKLTIHGKGNAYRKFLYVGDLCEAIDNLKKIEKPGIYNIASNEGYTVLEIAKFICKFKGKNFKKNLCFVKDRLYNDQSYAMKTNKIRQLGWKPKTKFKKQLNLICKSDI